MTLASSTWAFVLTSLLKGRRTQEWPKHILHGDYQLFIYSKGILLLVHTDVPCHKEICRSLLCAMCVLIMMC